jgi:hypothetical protein
MSSKIQTWPILKLLCWIENVQIWTYSVQIKMQAFRKKFLN